MAQPVPHLQFRSNCIFQFNKFSRDATRFKETQEKLTQNLLKADTYTGILKPGAKKRLTRAVELMVMCCQEKKWIYNPVTRRQMPFTLGFMTLTVYSTERNISGKEAHKQCLEPFLQWMRRVHGCQLYIWKAELQKRGQIHYHLTIDKFIHWKEIQSKWNELQQKAGYLESFYKKFKHYNPPSTDIHAVEHLKNLAGYIVKEITKNRQNIESIGGKVWDCSRNLKAGTYFNTVADAEYSARLSYLVQTKQVKSIITDHCVIFQMINKPAYTLLKPQDRLLYDIEIGDIKTADYAEALKEVKQQEKLNITKRIQATARSSFRIVNIMAIPDLFSTS